jgi:hypothetical protein
MVRLEGLKKLKKLKLLRKKKILVLNVRNAN